MPLRSSIPARGAAGLELSALGAVLARHGRVVGEHATETGIRAGEVADAAALGAALRTLAGSRAPRRARVAVASPRLLARTLVFPVAVEAGDLDSAVRFAAAEALPVPLESVALASIPQPPDPAGGTRVLIVAAPREALDPFARALADARFAGASLEPAGVALARLAPSAGVHAVVDAGALTTVTVADRRACAFTRTAATGLETAVEAVAAALGVDTQRARATLHAAAREQSDETEPAVAQAVDATVGRLCEEVRSSIDFHLRMGGSAAPEALLVVGEAANWPAVADGLQATLGLPVAVAHDDPAAVALALAGAPAVELMRVGRGDPAHGGPAGGRLVVPVAAAGVAAVASAVVGIVGLGHGVDDRRTRVAAARTQVAALERDTAGRPGDAAAARAQATAESVARQVITTRYRWEKVLGGVSWAAGHDVRIAALRATLNADVDLGSGTDASSQLRGARTGPAIELSGCGTSNRAVARFLARLGSVDGVGTVALDNTQRRGAQVRFPCGDGTRFSAVAFGSDSAPAGTTGSGTAQVTR